MNKNKLWEIFVDDERKYNQGVATEGICYERYSDPRSLSSSQRRI